MCRKVVSSLLAVSLASTGRMAALDFALGFEGCPAEVTGAEGELVSLEVFVALTTTGADSAAGAQGWEISLGADGGRIAAISLAGIQVSTILEHDGDPETPPLDPYDLSLAATWFSRMGLSRHDSDPARLGAWSSVILGTSPSNPAVLQPQGTARLARLTVEGRVPADITLYFEDGFGPRTRNIVTHESNSIVPSLASCTIRLRPGGCTGTPESLDCNADGVADECQLSGNDCDANGVPDGCDPDCDGNGVPDACDIASGVPDLDGDGIPDGCEPAVPLFHRGDCNADGEVRGVVTDAVFLLNFNFLGGPRPTCFAACDANSDGEVSGVVTDAVYLLTFNFLGGPTPLAPFSECGPGTEADGTLGCETAAEACGK